MKHRNPFSIKATIYVNGHKREINGPWRQTVIESVEAAVEQLKKKGLDTVILFRPFVAERCDPVSAPMADTKGNYYREHKIVNLDSLLTGKGLRTDPTNPTRIEVV